MPRPDSDGDVTMTLTWPARLKVLLTGKFTLKEATIRYCMAKLASLRKELEDDE